MADGAGDGDAWVGRFAGCDADHFGAGVEGSCYYEGFGDAGGGGGEGAGWGGGVSRVWVGRR